MAICFLKPPAAFPYHISQKMPPVIIAVFTVSSTHTRTYNNVYALFFFKHTALRRKDKDGLARNQDNVSE